MATPRRNPTTAADVMTPSPRTCSPFSTVLEAVLIFRDADCGAVPVVDAGEAVGVLTDRDVALALPDHADLGRAAVADIMTKGVVTVDPSTTLDVLKERFAEGGVRRLLVAEPGGALQGIITWADIAPLMSDTEIGEVVSEVVRKA